MNANQAGFMSISIHVQTLQEELKSEIYKIFYFISLNTHVCLVKYKVATITIISSLPVGVCMSMLHSGQGSQ